LFLSDINISKITKSSTATEKLYDIRYYLKMQLYTNSWKKFPNCHFTNAHCLYTLPVKFLLFLILNLNELNDLYQTLNIQK